MKILVIGDFHGKFPKKLQKKIKKEKFDIILSVGDFPESSKLRGLEFRYWGKIKSGMDFEKIIGKKKYKRILIWASKSMDVSLKSLKNFNKPIITVYGNADILNEEIKKYCVRGIETY